jgi:alpha-L-fucosidase
MLAEHIPNEEYAELADQFKPDRFDANAWAALAKEAGAKYMVLTTRHHDGYCLFDSKVSDFTSVKTAAGRDFVAEYAQAARKARLKVGFYYSLKDWRFDGYWDAVRCPDSARAMVDQAHAQVEELLTNYGRIDIMWFDGRIVVGVEPEHRAEFWRSKELLAMIRRLQPHILVNDRIDVPADIDTPEQRFRATAPGRAWELCLTMGDAECWGFTHHNPNFKSVTNLIQHLVTAAAGEGNLLLNVGPKPDGTIREEEVERMRAIGKWMATNGESIYGSQQCPFRGGLVGKYTAKGDVVYVHLFRWPAQGEIVIPGIKNDVLSATILGTEIRGAIERRSNDRTVITGLPISPPDPHDTVVKLVLDGKPEASWQPPETPFT